MHQTYFASFDLGHSQTRLPSLEDDVLPLVDEWLFRNRKIGRPNGFSFAEDADHQLENSTTIQTRSVKDGPGKRFITGIRFEHPDDEYRRWTSDVILTGGPGSKVRFSMRTYVRSQGDVIRPIRAPMARPRLVRRLVDSVGASDGLPITSKFARVGAADLEAFWHLLTVSERNLPVVYLSCANDSNAPLIDPGKLADRLSGIAHVCLAMNVGVSEWLESKLGRELNTFDGAMRIYWPRVEPGSNPYLMPLWTREKLLRYRALSPNFAIGDAMARIMDAALGRHLNVETRWEDVERAVARSRLAMSKAAGNPDEAWQLAQEMVDAADARARESAEEAVRLQERIQELQSDVAKADSDQSYWKDRAEALTRQIQNTRGETKAGLDAGAPSSVTGALQSLLAQYGDRIDVEWSKVHQRDCNQFEDVKAAAAAFNWIANVFYFAKKGWLPGCDLETSALQTCGFQYSANQSEVTMGQYASDYTVRVGEQVRYIKPHLRRGSSTQPRHALRIAFDFIPEYDKILIAFVGQHQSTRSSN
jgi:hypothetical protein